MSARRALWLKGLAGTAVAASLVVISGCGGASGPTWSSSGPPVSQGGLAGTGATSGRAATPQPVGTVRGVVELPARPRGVGRPVAIREWLRIGKAAHAETSLTRSPVSGARVYLIDRATRETVSTAVVTDQRGEFRISNITPSNRFSVVASEGQITLEAVLPTMEAGRQDVRVVLNECSTVGAEAARLAEEEGLGPEAAVQLAQQIATLQENYQAEHTAEVPDLSRKGDAAERARKHLLRTANDALAKAMDTGDKEEAWRALASAQLVARTRFKLPRKVVLTAPQADALVGAVVNKEARVVPAEKVAAALTKAGVKGKGGKAVTAEAVSAALDAVRPAFPCLKEVKAEKVPVLAALLLAEQEGHSFRITTREQMKAFLKELVGETGATLAAPKDGTTPPAQNGAPAPTRST